jgi:hypothetical protein
MREANTPESDTTKLSQLTDQLTEITQVFPTVKLWDKTASEFTSTLATLSATEIYNNWGKYQKMYDPYKCGQNLLIGQIENPQKFTDQLTLQDEILKKKIIKIKENVDNLLDSEKIEKIEKENIHSLDKKVILDCISSINESRDWFNKKIIEATNPPRADLERLCERYDEMINKTFQRHIENTLENSTPERQCHSYEAGSADYLFHDRGTIYDIERDLIKLINENWSKSILDICKDVDSYNEILNFDIERCTAVTLTTAKYSDKMHDYELPNEMLNQLVLLEEDYYDKLQEAFRSFDSESALNKFKKAGLTYYEFALEQVKDNSSMGAREHAEDLKERITKLS